MQKQSNYALNLSVLTVFPGGGLSEYSSEGTYGTSFLGRNGAAKLPLL